MVGGLGRRATLQAHAAATRRRGGAKERRVACTGRTPAFYRAARSATSRDSTIAARFRHAPSPLRRRSRRRRSLGRLAALALALAAAPCARADARRAGAARRRRLDLRRLRPAAGHRLGRPACGAARRAAAIRYRVVNASISGDTTAGGRARLPALLAAHKPAIVVIELGGNDGLRGGNLDVDARRISTRWSPPRRAPARRCCSSACSCRRTTAPAYVARVRRAVRRRRARRARRRSSRSSSQASASATSMFQPDRIHPTAAAQPKLLDNVWPALQPLLGAAAMTDARRAGAATARSTVDALGDYRRAHRRAQPGRVRRRPPARRARTIRCSTTPSARASARCTRRTRRSPRRRAGAALVARNIATMLETAFADKPRDWAPLVYCWRGGQRSRSLAHVLNEIGWRAVQLDGGYRAYRRHVVARLATLPGALSLRGRLRAHRFGQEPAARRARRARARRCSTSKRIARHRGSLLGDLPDDPQPSQKSFDSRARRRARSVRPGASGVRRVGEQEDRHGAAARRAARRDARAPTASASTRRCRCASRCSRTSTRTSSPTPTRWPRGSRTSFRCTARRRSSAGPPRPRPATGTRSSASCSQLHYDPAYARSIERNFPRSARAPSTSRRAALDRRRVPGARARARCRARERRTARLEHTHADLRLSHRQRLRRDAARAAIRSRCSRTRAASTTRRCRRSRCSSTCPRRRSSCRRTRATARVRIFTPTFEMPFAGHPTLGTAHVVRALTSAGDRGDAGDERRHHSGRRATATRGRSQANAPRIARGRGDARRARRDARARRGRRRARSRGAAAVGRHRDRSSSSSRSRPPTRCAAPRRAADLLLRHGQHRAARDGLRLRAGRRTAATPATARWSRASSFRSTARSSRTRAPAPPAPTSAAGCSRPARRCRSGSTIAQGDAVGRPCRLGLEVDRRPADPRVRARDRARPRHGHAVGARSPRRSPARYSVATATRPSTAPLHWRRCRHVVTPAPWVAGRASRARTDALDHRLRIARRRPSPRRIAAPSPAARRDRRRAGLRRRAPPAGAHRLRPDRRRSPRVRAADARGRRSTKLLRETRTIARDRRRPPSPSTPAPLRPPRGESATEEERKAFVQQQVREGLELRALVGAGDAGDAVAAHRADDAVLAQPFRVEPAEGAHRAAHVPAERHAARARARQLRRAAARDREGSGDARLSRQRAEPQGRAEREFRARGDGALHARRRPLHRAGHQGSGARVHRLEPRPRHAASSCSGRALHDDGDQDGARQDRAASTATRCSTSCSRGRRPREFVTAQAVARVRLARSRSAPKCSASPRAFATRATTSRPRCASCCSRDAFYAPENRGVLVKSPVELVVGTLRQLDLAAGRRAAVRGRRGRHGAEPVRRRPTSRAGRAARRGSTRRRCSRASSSSIALMRADDARRRRCRDAPAARRR